MDTDNDIELNDLGTIEARLHTEPTPGQEQEATETAASGFMVGSASGFMVGSASGFMVG